MRGTIRTERLATVVGLTTEAFVKGAGGATATAGAVKVLRIAWPNPVWAGVIGAIIGIIGAIAKAIRTENNKRKDRDSPGAMTIECSTGSGEARS